LVDVTIEDVGPCKKQLKITVPQADVLAKIEENYERLGDSAVVDGFRKGHVPRKLIERRFGEDILEEVKQSILSEVSEQAIEDNNLKVLGTPSFDNVEFDPEKDCVFEITLEIEPEFDLAEYKGLKVTKTSEEVSDDELSRGLESVRMQRASIELVADGEVAAGDQIVCDWELKSGDEDVASEKGYQLFVHGKSWGGVELEQTLEEALAGAKTDDAREIKGKILDSYPIEKWHDKDCVLHLTVQEIRRPKMPELDEEFAKALDFESIDELKDYVTNNIKSQKERSAVMEMEKQVFDQLIEAMPFDLPEGVLKAQARNTMMRQQYRMRMRGMPEDEMNGHLEELRDASEESAARSLKTYFILNRIAEKEKIFVAENEVESRIAAMASNYKISVQQMHQRIEQESSLAEVRSSMREDKTIEFLMSNTETIEETPKK
jgi:trigger factor